MKKLFLRMLAMMLMAGMFLVSCEETTDDDEKTAVENLADGILKGELTESYTLDASVSYQLTGRFTVDNGATLTIPAGTQIEATSAQGAASTDIYIAVMMGSKIMINGTASNPVIMSSTTATPGDWGGLTICGKAVTTEGENATAEVGGFTYGGTVANDNSGTISYLVIKGTGAQINSESQYNGVSFYAVGSGTTVNNLAVINGDDDGVEFFGGSVNVTNLYLENNSDDAIDWTEGWNGTVTDAYVQHTTEFSTAVEADGANENPTINNLTCVSTVGGTALQFKKESGATITGLSLSGYDIAVDMKNDGPLANVILNGAEADSMSTYVLPATVDPSDWSWIDATIVNGGAVSLKEGIINGVLAGSYTLDAATEYTITGSFIIADGGELTIPAGTNIIAEAGGTGVYMAVMMGGKININGTESEPVVISSANAEPGDWGGLTICGKATTTEGVDAVAEVGGFVYGGTTDNDNSGSISYLVIKGTGAQINSESQYNGVSFYAVGSGTTVNNLAVINGDDDGVEFFGGSVEVTNLYLENNSDDAIDWTEGWNGSVTNSYIKHTTNFSTVVEADGANENPTLTNLTAVCTYADGGTALQFKKQSGATITGLSLSGYTTIIDMKDDGPLTNVKIEGADASATATYDASATVDVAIFDWATE